jgi:hypothetical protein
MNPVSKVRIIVDSLTDDKRLQNKLLEILTHNLTVEQVEVLFEDINTRFKGEKVRFKTLFD